MERITCPHKCKVFLVKDRKKKSLKCPKCGCVFRFVVCRWTAKCFAKHHPNYGTRAISLKETRKKKKKRSKRGSRKVR